MAYINSKGLELKIAGGANWTITGAAGGIRTGTNANDVFYTLAGDILKGGLGDDTYILWDTTSKVTETAGQGNDTVYVNSWIGYQLPDNVENVVLASPAGNWATGNSLNNLIIAGAARATLDGGAGDDVLVGGDGADVFKVSAGGGSDVVYNFKPGWDAVKLSGYSFSTFAQLKSASTQTGADVVVKLSATETLTLRDTLLTSLTAADFSLPIAKAAGPAGGQTLYGPGQGVNANGWYVVTNTWGGVGVHGVDYAVGATYTKTDMTKGTAFNWSFPLTTDYAQTIKAFPEVIFGISPFNTSRSNPTDTKAVFPVKVADLTNFTATYDVSIAGNVGGFNVAYDVFLTNKAYGDASTVTAEVMIWVHRGDINVYGDLVGTYSKGDFTAKIYHTGKYTAVVADNDKLAGTIDVADILAKLKTLGYVSNNDFVASIELGSEVASGQGSLVINDLDLIVSSKTSDGGSVTKTVGGGGTTVVTTPPPAPPPPPPPVSGPEANYYKAGTVTLLDEHRVVAGTKTTTINGSTVTITKTDVVGKSLGYDVATLTTLTSTVKHFDGAGKLIGSDKLTFSADGSIVTTNRYSATGAAIETLKEYKTSAGVSVVEHYNANMVLTGVDKSTIDGNGLYTVQHFSATNAFLGYETIATASDGTVTVRYNNAYWQLTGMETYKTVNGVTTNSHFDIKGAFTGADVSTIDANGVVKTQAFNSSFKTVESISYTGTDRADTLNGNTGITHFFGGLGSDKIVGGAGADFVHFDSLLTQGDVDTVTGFQAATDKIVLDRSVFTAFTGAGALDPNAFVAGTAALDAGDRILFDKATGSLWYDDDGIGAHAPILLATISADGALTASNFLTT